ncbi:MAG: hypothetical protein LBJ48_03660, partial [Coriobacteriales bacterium]|nr:hypothetical protein [Coriobacteriales bacterium]
SQYRKLKYGRTRQVIFDTAMAVCVGLDLGLEYGVPLLEKAGYSLEGEDRFPYKVLLAFYRGHTIFECNEYLIDQGVKPLREAVCRGSSGKK